MTGEARRTPIGRPLVDHPGALLQDEPSAILNLVAQQEVREMVRKLAHSTSEPARDTSVVGHHSGDRTLGISPVNVATGKLSTRKITGLSRRVEDTLPKS